MTWQIFNAGGDKLNDAMIRAWDDLARDITDEQAAELREKFLAAQSMPPLHVYRHAMYLPVSEDLLMDEGVIPDTRPPLKVGWRTRFRWWLSSSRERFGRWLGGKIAGVDLTDRDDW